MKERQDRPDQPPDGLDHDVVYSIFRRRRRGLGRQAARRSSELIQQGDSFAARTFTQADGLAQNSIYSVHRDRDGTVWAGTISAGVSTLRSGKLINYSEANGLLSNAVNSIVEGADGTIWLATPNGLDSYFNGRWKHYSARDGLPASNVKTIFEDTQHVLWIATSGGLACFQSGVVQVPPRLPEELHEQVLGIAEDRMGSLWFTTSDHVLRVNRDRLLDGSVVDTDVQSYGIEDGLQGTQGVGRDRSVVADNQGRIWIALNSGLSMADPKVTSTNAVPVKVRIESISAGGRPVDAQNPVKLSSGIQSITFNFAETNLAVPERISFRYKLDGSDRGWSDIVASRQVVYSNLGPGSYRFHVVASNSEGLWNGPETSIPFVIEPAFWQTWWFRTACLAGSFSSCSHSIVCACTT